ncbi:hypothetical protein B1L04_11750 [Microcystis aeruginosa KW]|uniref:Uncharacterized protein n=1 Tax=Microcystis aeruginosa KW TaxID=1960155 RepID=A0A1V4BQV0_MICAE|nr:hypothetical protein B1L04_11750 [Microcystis aeruginosa KW]
MTLLGERPPTPIITWVYPDTITSKLSPIVRQFIENLGLKPRRSTTALLLNMSIVYEIYAKM